MARTLLIAMYIWGLAGCADMAGWSLLGVKPSDGPANRPDHYNFNWRLSGDRAVAPVQVFDNGRETWLQFTPGQALPAIFQHTSDGDRPLEFHREGPYVVLSRVWPRLVLRGGHLACYVDQISEQVQALPITAPDGPPQADAKVEPVGVGSVVAADASADVASDIRVEAADATPTETPADMGVVDNAQIDLAAGIVIDATPDVANGAAVQTTRADVLVPGPAFTATSFSLPESQSDSEPERVYRVSPADKNLRLALSRWAKTAGWMFKSEHWAVDADIPIVGSARFDAAFRPAVQDLVASTELADRPLQPCFYSNKVLRIVPYAQSCDRTASMAEPS